ncbi:agmatinase [uncultured Desulfosarcina sp.]|uniref:agmatinase n=1 Tax=uncultured Desulfosarcina sp. TaxID=218289 RepID=UPI0029C80EF5|nr:agmatinase [uncultured Desulfosarcina sp.]
MNSSDGQSGITVMAPDTLALIGVPFDEYSSFLRGPAKAPAAIRRVLHNGASNLFAENGVNLDGHPGFCDIGDLTLPEGEDAIAAIQAAIAKLASARARVLALGGDHAVTFPIVDAITTVHEGLSILHFDAHPDLYETYAGSRFSHACPFARILETGRIDRLVQVGIRGMNDLQRRQVEKYGVTCIEMKDFRPDMPMELKGPLYISLDMDVLDPAYAPGVSHHEPGGMATRDVLELIQSIQCPIVGADIVEYNPDRDVNEMTAAVAAKFLKELAGIMLRQNT